MSEKTDALRDVVKAAEALRDALDKAGTEWQSRSFRVRGTPLLIDNILQMSRGDLALQEERESPVSLGDSITIHRLGGFVSGNITSVTAKYIHVLVCGKDVAFSISEGKTFDGRLSIYSVAMERIRRDLVKQKETSG